MSAAAPRAARRRRARARRARERGIALVMVLGAIAVLTVLLFEFQEETSAELAAAKAERDGVQAEYHAKSAVALSRLLIAAEPTMRQAISPLFMMMKRTPPQIPVWEFSDRVLGAFNGEDDAQAFTQTSGLDLGQGKNLGLKGGRFEVVIVDEDAKINANLGASNEIAHIRLARQLMAQMAPLQYTPLFEQKDSTGNVHDRFQVCAAIIDWADTDEQYFSCDTSGKAPSGAVEDAFYQLLPKAYRRKNAPYDSLEELHLVRGVSDDFWATMIDPDPANPKKRNVTVWGQGTVNVNTANPQTLLALVCSGVAPTTELCNDPLQMQQFVTILTMAKGMTMGAPLWGNVNDFIKMMKGEGPLGTMLTGLGLKPIKFLSDSEFGKTISTESKIFSVYAVGAVKGYKRETRVSVHAVVDFRGAPNLNQANPLGAGQAPGAAPTTPGAVPTAPGAPAGRTDPNAFSAALQPATGGQFLYYHIE